jgi:hypothetical protein
MVVGLLLMLFYMLKFKFGLLMVERCRSWLKESWWFEISWRFWYHSDDCKLCHCFIVKVLLQHRQVMFKTLLKTSVYRL